MIPVVTARKPAGEAQRDCRPMSPPGATALPRVADQLTTPAVRACDDDSVAMALCN